MASGRFAILNSTLEIQDYSSTQVLSVHFPLAHIGRLWHCPKYNGMRISSPDAKTIRGIVTTYDPLAAVKLFGSQARDEAVGGDIDLLIISARIGLLERLQIEADLQDAFGVRRFDLVVSRPDKPGPFFHLINQQAVPL